MRNHYCNVDRSSHSLRLALVKERLRGILRFTRLQSRGYIFLCTYHSFTILAARDSPLCGIFVSNSIQVLGESPSTHCCGQKRMFSEISRVSVGPCSPPSRLACVLFDDTAAGLYSSTC
jgi:hypothetical protein